MTTIPATFRRPGSSRAVGCLVYSVVAPFVSLFLALFISLPVGFALEALGLSKTGGNLSFVILLPIIAVAVVAWGYRDYRNRAALEVIVDRRCVSIGVGSNQRVLNFADVDSIRVATTRHGFACVLIPRSGRSLRLPPEIAPFEMAREPLDETLIPLLVQRLDSRLTR